MEMISFIDREQKFDIYLAGFTQRDEELIVISRISSYGYIKKKQFQARLFPDHGCDK